MYEIAKGCLFFNKKIKKSLYNTLMDFYNTRHYKRAGKEKDGLLYLDPYDKEAPDWRSLYEQQGWDNAVPKEVADYSTVVDGAPSLYCHWKPSPDRMGLEFDKCGKAENLLEWLKFLIQYFIKPNGYLISGEITIQYNVGISVHVNGKVTNKDWHSNTIVIKDNEII